MPAGNHFQIEVGCGDEGEMTSYKKEFIEFLVKENALQFGEFTLKSGRISPYFFNAASFNSGATIARLGYFYAAAVCELAPDSTLIFGPAYKGIPLCLTTVIALSAHFNQNKGYFFNRKETKTHGDKGTLVGKLPTAADRIVMVDDVITDGATKREALKQVRQVLHADFSLILIAVDRMETNGEGKDAAPELQAETNIPVKAIVSIEEICQYLRGREIEGAVVLTEEIYHRIEAYLQTYRIRK